jgi:very-short-patch-repair endonuclease
MEWTKYCDFQKTVEKYGIPKNSKSSIIFVCSSCGSDSTVDLNSLKARVRRNKNTDFQIRCSDCARKNWDRIDPEILGFISLEQTKELFGVPKNKHDRIVILCSQCSEPHSLKVQSLKMRIWSHQKVGKVYTYSCKKCLSGGSAPEDLDLDRVVDWDATREKFGTPRTKKDKIIFRCSYCRSGSDIRLDSLKNAIRKHKKTSKEPFRHTCLSCYSDSERAKEIRSLAVKKVTSEGFVSKIEIATSNILKSLDIEYKSQHPVGYYSFDFFLPNHKTLIEVQGEYWHGKQNGARRDSAKFTYINKYFSDLRVLYLHERDFFNPKIVEKKISDFLSGSAQVNQISFSFKDVKVRQADKSKLEKSRNYQYVDFLNSHHYAQFGRKEKFVVGAYLDDELIAICKFASVVRKEVATSLGNTTKEVMELDRFCIHPGYQKKNFASWFLSRCSKLAFDEFEVLKKLVSFADTTFDHEGTIYKAANWTFLSKTRPSYFYLSPEGFVIHKKTLYEHAVKMGMKESEYVEKFGYEKRQTKKKYKFILDR